MMALSQSVSEGLAERIRAIFSVDCAIPDTSMVFGTVVDHDRLSIFRYRTTLTNVHCACAVHFRATRLWYKHENCVRYNIMAYLFYKNNETWYSCIAWLTKRFQIYSSLGKCILRMRSPFFVECAVHFCLFWSLTEHALNCNRCS